MLDKPGFKPARVTAGELRALLERHGKNRFFTGVRIIDDVYGGINEADIVLVGAKSGAGKTELITEIGMNARAQGKRVFIFALEAEEQEIQMRMIFKKVAKWVDFPIFYKKWYRNDYPKLASLESKAIEELGGFEGMEVFYRNGDFSVDDFRREVMAVRERADLIIVDHIHYFDLEGKNENRELSDAVKKIRDVALLTNLPVILVAHMRKDVVGKEKLVPDMEDFQGTSDLYKVCTKAVILSARNPINGKAQTFFHFPKFRQHGSSRSFLFATQYDVRTNTYEDNYKTYYFKYNSPKLLGDLQGVSEEDLGWLG